MVRRLALQLIVLIAALAGVDRAALANHPDDSCPDTHVDGSESMDGMVANYVSWESYPDGAQVPPGTQLVATGHATAFGYCDLFIWSGTSCVPAAMPREDRMVTAINTWVRKQDPWSNGEAWGVIFGWKQDFDAYGEQKWSNWQSGYRPTIFTYRFRNTIHTTQCQVGEAEFWGKPVTIYMMPDLRCPEGDTDSNIGNPCNAGTGNKHGSETDYRSASTGLTFTRTYNSGLPIDFGLGHGWITNFHKRLEKFSTWLRIRRGNAAGDIFTSSGGAWTGPPDSSYTLTQDATGYTVSRRNGSSERYALSGRITSETDTVGRTTSYTYDTNGRLLAVTGPFGHVLSFAYNSAGRLQTVIDPALKAISYSYDTDNNLANVTYPDNTVRTYHYELTGYPYHALTGVTDENGDRYATFGYDTTSGKATFTQHAQTTNGQPQEKFSLVYNSATQTTVTDPAGNAEVFTFLNQHGVLKLLTRTSLVDSKRITQAFDGNNNLTSLTDAESRVTKYTYNATNQRLTMTEAFGTPQARTRSYEYLSPTVDLVTKVTSASVAAGQQREVIMSYNPALTIASVSTTGYRPNGAPVSRVTSMLYNAQGQVTQLDGPRTDVSDVTQLEYYLCTIGAECGQLKKITNALGHITTFDTYDAHGRLTQMTDPNGLVTSYSYDLRGRVLSITEGSRVTSFTYDAAGQLETVTTPGGEVLTYDYDAAHDLGSITDNLGNKISYTYDLKGNRKTEETRDPANTLKKTITYTHDLRNRLDTINAAGSISDLLFDTVGNLKQELDPNSQLTSHNYDPLDRLQQTTDALTGTTNYVYDSHDHLTQLQAPNGATTTYVYDDLGNLLEHASPDTGLTTYGYDAAGNRTSMTDARGVLTSYSYDALNRPQTVTYPTTSLNQTFTYDIGVNQKGRLTGATDASGPAAYTYDLHGALTGNGRTISGHVFSTGYGYDGAGQLETIVYPASGRLVTYTRNTLGQITQVTTTVSGVTTVLANQFQYLPFGPVRQFTLGNGIAVNRSHDQQYRLDALTDTGSANVRDRSYTHDPAGNVDRIQDNLSSPQTQDFVQDVLNRITSDSSSYGAVTYLYDAAGNRTERKRGTTIEQTITYVSSSNRLNLLNSSAFTYDPAGNTLTDGPGNRTFTYDDTGRLTEARLGGILRGTYLYNADGQRVRKVEASGAQRVFFYHYGLQGELLAETLYNTADQKIAEREYIWLGNLPLAFAERTFDPATGVAIASQLAYLHPDHLGTPRLATDQAQRIVWRWSADAFGVGAADTDPDADTIDTFVGIRFPGQYFDSESGLHYNYFRDYDPATGRYPQSDPIGLEGGLNTYAYADADPLRFSDPAGLAPKLGKIRRVECNSEETERCRSSCAAQGKLMESCRRVERWSLTRAKQTGSDWLAEVYGWKKIGESCSCHEPNICERNPTACAVGIGLGVCALILTPWPDDVLIPGLIGVGTATASQ